MKRERGLTHEGADVEPGEVVGDPALPLVDLVAHITRVHEAPEDEAPEQEDRHRGGDDLRGDGEIEKR